MPVTHPKNQQTVSPIDNTVYAEREYATDQQIQHSLLQAKQAQHNMQQLSVAQRADICHGMIRYFETHKTQMAEEITYQMGRPISHTPFEIDGCIERAKHMIDIADSSLQTINIEQSAECQRFIKREPLGTVFVIAPWNYPYLTAVNSIVPAIMAGNSVILKHSAQTPLCAERFYQAFLESGLPTGGLQYLHLKHQQVANMISSPDIDFVAFTGSVDGGHAIVRSAAERFIGLGLELGGKDPAYVRADADMQQTVDSLVDGAFFNSGQSCCGIERIYVQQDIFDPFVKTFCNQVEQYQLDDPLLTTTTLGPMVRTQAADIVRQQIQQAMQAGAKPWINNDSFSRDNGNSSYLAPQVLTEVNHSMDIMREETFGPVVGIMPVTDDQHAIQLMNDSNYGLTASVWTQDRDAGLQIADHIATGTCFVNRCDYLDPALAWTGVKNTGRGCTLSQIGYEQLTRPKSFYIR